MLLKIIHISDFHIRSKFSVDYVLNTMEEALNYRNNEVADDVLLLITGDLTNSANEGEFNIFKNFIEKVKENIEKQNKKVYLFFVPGNHDIQLSKKEENRTQQIKNAFSENNIDDFIENDVIKMKNFFAFSSNYNIFTTNNFFDSKILNINNKRIRINLLNTACLSTLDYTDKENHYINPENFNFDNDRCDCTISLMHHSSEWFEEKSKEAIDLLIKNSDLYLFGHQHKKDTIHSKDSLGFLCGQFKTINYDSSSSFYIHIIEFTDKNLNNNISTYLSTYNDDRKKYICNSEELEKHDLFPKDITINSYYEEMNTIDIEDKKIQLSKIFVMPNLTIKKDDININQFEDLIDFIDDKKYVIINGAQQTGKTTLLKNIFLHYYGSKKKVVYMKKAEISYNFKNAIKYAVIENYKNFTYNEFEQLDKQEKILLIDDSTGISKEFLDEAKNVFSIIILCKNHIYKSRSDLLINGEALDFCDIKIERFTLKQRNELIEKFSNLHNENIHNELISICLESVISNNNFIDMSSPYYISVILDKIISEKLYESRDTSDSFSIVFEHSISSKLIKAFGKNKMEDFFILLRELAFIIYSKKEYKITINDLKDAIELCKESWDFKSNLDTTLEGLKKSKIIVSYENDYRFADNNYYSYFVAKYIHNKIENGEDISDILNNLTENIVFGNYSEILLFVAYFVGSKYFFQNIIRQINEGNKNWECISFDKNNSYILKRIIKEGINIPLKIESKQEQVHRLDENEKNKLKNDENKNDEEDFKKTNSNELDDAIRSLKLIEILAKGVASYKTKLDKPTRRLMILTLKDSLFKFINRVFSLTDEEYEEFYKDIQQSSEEVAKRKNIEIPKEKLEKLITNVLYDLLTTFTLNIFTGIASTSCSKHSISLIDDMEDFDENGKLIFDNVLFKSIYYERYGNEEKFVHYINLVYENIKTKDQKHLINRIFALFTITSKISKENIDHCCSLMKIDKNKLLAKNNELNKILKIKNKSSIKREKVKS